MASVMNRRAFVGTVAGSLLAAPLAAEAQQTTKVTSIGYLSGPSLSANAARIEAFRQGLRELSYVEGKTSSLSGDLPTENSRASQRSRPN
jgi:hypothetical protein